MNPHWPIEVFVHDMLKGPVPGKFDAAYALDVLEHIPEKDKDRFIRNTIASLTPEGVAIFGMPSLESQPHASPQSKAGHVNCKSGDALKRTLERYFHTVFVFSMNDEVVHTGFIQWHTTFWALPAIAAKAEAQDIAMLDRAAATSTAGPVLSVVLPNYNHAEYLPRALDALLSQARPPDEIIVVDDCSTDGSRDIVTRYAAKHPPIRLVPNDSNAGVIPTLSRGLGEARGQFVYFGAADDFVLPGFFETAISATELSAGRTIFWRRKFGGRTIRPLSRRPPAGVATILGGLHRCPTVARLLRQNDNFVVTGAAVFRRDAVISAGGFQNELSTFADGYLVRKIALTRGFCYAPMAVMTWCVFPGGVSRTTSTHPDRAKQLLAKIVSRLATDPAFPDWYADVFKRRWHFSTARLALRKIRPIASC